MQKSKTKRRTRPEPERTTPDRAWTRNARRNGASDTEPPQAVGRRPRAASASAPGGSVASPGAATNASPGKGTNAGKSASAGKSKSAGEGAPAGADTNAGTSAPNGARSSAFRTLNDAYRLVDEYLRQGQEMAENVWQPFVTNGIPGWPAPGAPERFLRAVGDMTLAWVEAMQGLAGAQNPAARPASGTAGPFDTGGAASPAPSPAPTRDPAAPNPNAPQRELGVSVEAKGRVEVALAVSEPGAADELAVGELEPTQGKAAPIRDVTLRAEATRVVVRVVVPEGQPRGRYNGFLLDAKTQKPRGTLSVVVL